MYTIDCVHREHALMVDAACKAYAAADQVKPRRGVPNLNMRIKQFFMTSTQRRASYAFIFPFISFSSLPFASWKRTGVSSRDQ
jgi:hypothetical protein